ncbi:MAG: pyridoxal phosphate-dependent aminotransferase [Burkholderiales bacterium]
MAHLITARPAVQALRSSKIREVANAGMGGKDLLAFWFGEPDEVTPDFILQAGIEALQRGETFYTQNFGVPELREAIASYLTCLHDTQFALPDASTRSGSQTPPSPSGTRAGDEGRHLITDSSLHFAISPDNIAVTNSGMSALMLTTQALISPGDRVVVITPVWPNLVEIPKILGAQVETFPLTVSPQGWALDLERLLATLTPDTRAVYLNSPNNPTGWTITRDQQIAILAHCRRHGIWIPADDAYERLYYADAVAPSFLDICNEQDRLVSTNTFSKSWLMTGWRLGWIVAPRELMPALGTLIEYNTSCAPGFVQRAGIAAIEQGDPVIARTQQRFRKARDFLCTQLRTIPGVEVSVPSGAMYAFFKMPRVTDSLAFCKGLVAETGLGLAPGIAFGPEGEGFVRWCFASNEDRLAQGIERLRRYIGHR